MTIMTIILCALRTYTGRRTMTRDALEPIVMIVMGERPSKALIATTAYLTSRRTPEMPDVVPPAA